MPAKTSQAPSREYVLDCYKPTDLEGVGTSSTSWDKKRYTPKIITPKQYQQIRKEIPKVLNHIEWLDTFYQTLFDVLRYTGLRLGEALRLRLSDINWNEQHLIIRKQKNGRVCDRQPIPNRLLEQLEKHVQQYRGQYVACKREEVDFIGDNRGCLFFSRNKSRDWLSGNAANMFMTRLRKRSDLPILSRVYGYSSDGKPLHIVSYHTLRHLYITEAVQKVGLAKAQSLARHDWLESTIRYTHINLEGKKQAIKEMYG